MRYCYLKKRRKRVWITNLYKNKNENSGLHLISILRNHEFTGQYKNFVRMSPTDRFSGVCYNVLHDGDPTKLGFPYTYLWTTKFFPDPTPLSEQYDCQHTQMVLHMSDMDALYDTARLTDWLTCNVTLKGIREKTDNTMERPRARAALIERLRSLSSLV
jgi:hypothetical protein